MARNIIWTKEFCQGYKEALREVQREVHYRAIYEPEEILELIDDLLHDRLGGEWNEDPITDSAAQARDETSTHAGLVRDVGD